MFFHFLAECLKSPAAGISFETEYRQDQREILTAFGDERHKVIM